MGHGGITRLLWLDARLATCHDSYVWCAPPFGRSPAGWASGWGTAASRWRFRWRAPRGVPSCSSTSSTCWRWGCAVWQGAGAGWALACCLCATLQGSCSRPLASLSHFFKRLLACRLPIAPPSPTAAGQGGACAAPGHHDLRRHPPAHPGPVGAARLLWRGPGAGHAHQAGEGGVPGGSVGGMPEPGPRGVLVGRRGAAVGSVACGCSIVLVWGPGVQVGLNLPSPRASLQTTTPTWRCWRATHSRCRPSRTAMETSTCCCTRQVATGQSALFAWEAWMVGGVAGGGGGGVGGGCAGRGCAHAALRCFPQSSDRAASCAVPTVAHMRVALLLLLLLQAWRTSGWQRGSTGFVSSRTQTGWCSARCPPRSVRRCFACRAGNDGRTRSRDRDLTGPQLCGWLALRQG